LVMVHTLPAMQAPFRFAAVELEVALAAAACGLIPLLFNEALKLRKRQKRQPVQ